MIQVTVATDSQLLWSAPHASSGQTDRHHFQPTMVQLVLPFEWLLLCSLLPMQFRLLSDTPHWLKLSSEASSEVCSSSCQTSHRTFGQFHCGKVRQQKTNENDDEAQGKTRHDTNNGRKRQRPNFKSAWTVSSTADGRAGAQWAKTQTRAVLKKSSWQPKTRKPGAGAGIFPEDQPGLTPSDS